MNVGSGRLFMPVQQVVRRRSATGAASTFCDNTFSARLRSRPSMVDDGGRPMPLGAVSRLLIINGVVV